MINVEGNNGICSWELSISNPRLISKARRQKTTYNQEQPAESQEARSKEYEFVDAPAWRICVDPNTYSYVPNNGRYRASKLVKKIDNQRYAARRLQYQQVPPERQQLQREIQRDLRQEFEMYLKQEKEKDDREVSTAQPLSQQQVEDVSMMNTFRSKIEDTDGTSGESDVEKFEAKEWRGDSKEGMKRREGSIAIIEEPSSVLKVSNGNGIGYQRKSKHKAKMFPSLSQAGNPMSGDQFLQEVSARLLHWEQERKGLTKNTQPVNRSTETEGSQVNTSLEVSSSRDVNASRDHRSKSEPPTISELIDRHQHRSGYYADLAPDNTAALHYGSLPLSVLGSNTTIKEEPIRYRLPKQNTDSTSIKDHIKRHLSQNSAPIDRLPTQYHAEVIGVIKQGSETGGTKLPPRGESIPIRTPLKALQPATKKTETVSHSTFSVRRIASTSTDSNTPPRENSGVLIVENKELWDYDDRAIDAVFKHQMAKDTSNVPTTTHTNVLGVLRSNPSIQAPRVVTNTSPLNAIAVVNHIKYTPENAVPKHKKTEPLAEHPYEMLERENSYLHLGHSPRNLEFNQGNPLQMLVTTTKLNHTYKAKKPTGKSNFSSKPSVITIDKPKKSERVQKADTGQVDNDNDMSIGVSGKKIGYNETTQRII